MIFLAPKRFLGGCLVIYLAGGAMPEMGKLARDALARAAERAARRVQLENAKILIDKTLGFELAEEQAAWMSVLSMPYMSAYTPWMTLHPVHIIVNHV